MKRTAEKTLSIIGAILSLFGIVMSFIGMSLINYLESDPMFQEEFEAEMLLTNPTLNAEDLDVFNTLTNFFGGTMWFIIIGLIISLILTIIGIVNIWNNKNAKLAGTMFIIAGVLAGIISFPSILLYIAGILCFTRKPPLTDKPQFGDEQYDGTMRPL